MFEPKRILVPTDLSEPSTTALETAREFAAHYGARITLLYADQFIPSIDFIEAPTTYFVEHLPELEEAINAKLGEYAEQHLANSVYWETAVVMGSPATAILDEARSRNCDMIAMGTHGRTGWKRIFAGSVAESVLAESRCPVLTVRQPIEGASFGGIRRILCPVNYTDVAAKALDCAVSLAEKFRAELIVAHVMEHDGGYDHSGELEQLREWMPEGLRARTELKDLVLRGHAAEQVLELARTASADLLVLGAQHKRFSDTTVIGTTTERITRHAQCPVLTVARPVETARVPEEEHAALAAK